MFGDSPEQQPPRRSNLDEHTSSGAPRPQRTGRHGVDEALLGAADAVADMARRVQLNGPEPTYASEKLSFAVYKAAEGLALCDVELEEVTGRRAADTSTGRAVRQEAQ